MRRARIMARSWVRWVGGAWRRPGSRFVHRPAAPEGAAGEPRANTAAEAGLAPAAGSRGCPALAAGEPMAQSPPTGLTKSQCHPLLAMAALASVLAAPVRAQSETTARAGRQLATAHCSRCHGFDDERFILRPGALPLRDLKLLYSADDLGEALAASLRTVHFDLSTIFSREEMAALLSYLNSLW